MKLDIQEDLVMDPTEASLARLKGEEEEKLEDVASCWICERPGMETSDFYCDMRYCSKQHRDSHHPEDHDEPWPFVIKYREGTGRLMVAARDIDQGELIFTEEHLVGGPNHTLWGDFCLDCLKKVEDGYTCTSCWWPVCNAECEKGPSHSIECSLLTEKRDSLDLASMREDGALYWPISTLRVLLLGQSNPLHMATVRRMLSHVEEHRAKTTYSLYNKHLVDTIRDRLGLGEHFTQEEVEHVSGMIDVNSIRLGDNGHGVYLKTSIMSHSCLSNTKTILNEDKTVDVRAVVQIPQGTEITKAYCSSLETTQLRQEKLKEGWYFSCRCLRCSDPLEGLSFMSSVVCLKCKEGLLLSTDPLDLEADWMCGTCGVVKTADSIQKLNQYFVAAIVEATGDCMSLDNLLEKAMKMFHPWHQVCTLARIKLNTAFLKLGSRNPDKAELELLMRRKELLDDIHQVIEVIEPGLTQRRGLSLFERSICHLQLGRELYDKKKFGPEDFATLLRSEIASFEDVLECLEHSSTVRGGLLDDIVFKAGAAKDDAESWLCQIEEGEL